MGCYLSDMSGSSDRIRYWEGLLLNMICKEEDCEVVQRVGLGASVFGR